MCDNSNSGDPADTGAAPPVNFDTDTETRAADAEAAQPEATGAGADQPDFISVEYDQPDGLATGAARDVIQITNEVITQLIIIAAGRVEGIKLPSAGVGDGIAGFLGMKGHSRGVRIDKLKGENTVDVDISVNIEYGYKINEAAKALQDGVRNELSEMAGLNVPNVNVHVLSLNMKEQDAD